MKIDELSHSTSKARKEMRGKKMKASAIMLLKTHDWKRAFWFQPLCY
jgi:hypothetical protein